MFVSKGNLSVRDNRVLLLSVLSGLTLTLFLQGSIRIYSLLNKSEAVMPELHVSWLAVPQQMEEVSIKKPPVKTTTVVKKKVVKKRKVVKKKTKPMLPEKNMYSAMALKVKETVEKKTMAETVERKVKKQVDEKSKQQEYPSPVPVFRLTQAPHFLHKEPLVYPESMRTLGTDGIVKLSVLIDKYGVVRKVTVVESAGKAFDEQARISMHASTFFAAKVKDKPVAAILKISVKFNLI